MTKIKKWIPLLAVLAFLIVFYFSGVKTYFTFEWLQANEIAVQDWVDIHWLLAPMFFIALNLITTVFLIPVGVFLALVGGLFFSLWLGTLYALIGTTVGSAIVFLVARSPLQSLFTKIAGSRLINVEKALQNNQANYLLLARLIPISPAWLINLAAAFFGVRFWTFVWTAWVGNLPPTLILVEIGSDLNVLLHSGKELSMHTLFSWKAIAALVGLAILSILPIFIKKQK